MTSAVKTVGRSGQISLGKEYAGRQVIVEETAPGVWVIKAGTFVPDSERWLHESPVRESLDRAIAATSTTAPADRLDELKERVDDGNGDTA